MTILLLQWKNKSLDRELKKACWNIWSMDTAILPIMYEEHWILFVIQGIRTVRESKKWGPDCLEMFHFDNRRSFAPHVKILQAVQDIVLDVWPEEEASKPTSQKRRSSVQMFTVDENPFGCECNALHVSYNVGVIAAFPAVLSVNEADRCSVHRRLKSFNTSRNLCGMECKAWYPAV